MALPKWLTTVTPLSKAVALIIFTTFPIMGFVLGIKYGYDTKICNLTTETKIIKVAREETERDLLKRCGPLPDNAYFKNKQHYDVVDGPAWSPDCRNVAYSIWESGPGYMGDDPKVNEALGNNLRKLSGREGVFIYNEATDKTKKIYTPTQLNETPVFEKWENRSALLFKAGGNSYRYDLTKDKLEKVGSN